jgi:hypothetical protein
MLRPAIFLALAVALQGANAQVEPHGPPASVLSPTSPGAAHGTPSSVLSPTPQTFPNGRVAFAPRRHVAFGNPRHRRPRQEFVPVPIFIPAYPLSSDYVDSEQATAPDANDAQQDSQDSRADAESLHEAYNRGARDALARERDALAQQRDSRYGEHYLDGREQSRSRESSSNSKDAAPEPASPSASEPDNTPATVFIFKDGHKMETQNYAIVGDTLFDFSNNGMHKIKLADLDLDATKKANDNLGITVKLPNSTP